MIGTNMESQEQDTKGPRYVETDDPQIDKKGRERSKWNIKNNDLE